jgi:uncharacterized protein DUF5666
VTSTGVAHTAARAIALLALLSPLWLAEHAHAQRRDFVGRVTSISPQSLVVKDRRGNAVTFVRAENTVVEGKTGWEAVAAGDKVLVRWNLGSGLARQVVVLEGPPRAAPR